MQPRAKRRFWNSPTFLYPAIALTFIGLGAAGYYFFWTTSRQADLNDEDFRILAGVADQLRSRISNIDSILHALAPENDAKEIGRYLAAQAPDLRESKECFAGAPREKAQGPEFAIITDQFAEEYGRIHIFHGRPPRASWLFSIKDVKHCLVAGIDSTIQPIVDALPDAFDEVLLADHDGSVVFQTAGTGIRVAGLDAIFDRENRATSSEKPENDDNKGRSGGGAAEARGGSPHEAQSLFLAASRFSNVSIHQIGGDEYRVYISPVSISFGPSEKGGGHDIILAGLVRKDHFRTQMLAPLGPILITWIIFATIVITGSWPLLKFSKRRRTERVYRPAGILLVLSTLTTVTLLTLLMLDLQDRSLNQIGRRLGTIAGKIDDNLHDETKTAFDALELATKKVSAENALPKKKEGAGNSGRNCFRVPRCRADLLTTDTYLLASYPWLDNMVWLDDKGNQVYKWSVRQEVTPETMGTNYAYFQETIVNHTWTLHEHPNFRFRIDPLYSPNTGEYLAILTTPFTAENETRAAYHLRVANLAAPMASLIYPVLPPDYGFAIIDPDGTVLFHSDPARNQREDFYQEFKNPEQIRAAIDSDSPEPFGATYHGRNYLFRASRLKRFEDCPWVVVVFADTTAAQAWHLERMLVGGMLTLFHTAVLTISAFLVSLFLLPSYPVRWAWPSAEARGVYLHLALAYAVMFTASILWVFYGYFTSQNILLLFVELATLLIFTVTVLKVTGRESWLGAISLLLVVLSFFADHDQFEVCVFAAAIGFLALPGVSAFLQGAAGRLSKETCFAVAGIAMVFQTASAPCIAFFKLAYDFEERQHLKRDQMLVFDSLQRRSERVSHRYEVIRIGDGLPRDSVFDPVRTVFLKQRLLDCLWDRYDLQDDDEPALHAQASLENEVDRGVWRFALDLVASIPNNRVATARRLNYPQSEDGDWKWIDESPNRLRLSRNEYLGGVFTRVASENIDFQPPSLVGEFEPLRRLNESSWVWFLLTAAALFTWLRSTVKRLFIASFTADPQWPVMAFDDPAAASENRIFIGLPWSGKTTSVSLLPDCDRIDLADVVNGASFDPDKLTSPVTALDHFEYQIENREICGQRLRLIEYLLFQKKKCVWIVTNIDPKFLFDETILLAGESAGEQTETADVESWRSMLSIFAIARLPYASRADAAELYPALWSSCTVTEKIVLYQLARDGWVNDRNSAALTHVVRRHLVRYSLGCQFIDEGFRNYVLQRVTSEKVHEWEEAEGPKAWDGLKIVLVMCLIVLLLLGLLYAQQQFLALVTASLSTLGTGFKVVTDLRSKSGARSANG